MASLGDLQAVTASGGNAGLINAAVAQESGFATNENLMTKGRGRRNMNTFDMPNLIGAQAARGAFSSSGTNRKTNQMMRLNADQEADSEFALRRTLMGLATKGLLAQSGIQL